MRKWSIEPFLIKIAACRVFDRSHWYKWSIPSQECAPCMNAHEKGMPTAMTLVIDRSDLSV